MHKKFMKFSKKSATRLLEDHRNVKITIVEDRPFAETCSFGPAGYFRPIGEKYL